MTNIRVRELTALGITKGSADFAKIHWIDQGVENQRELPWIRTYSERRSGTLVPMLGSSERLEIGVVDESAIQLFKNELPAVHLRLTTTGEDIDTILACVLGRESGPMKIVGCRFPTNKFPREENF